MMGFLLATLRLGKASYGKKQGTGVSLCIFWSLPLLVKLPEFNRALS